MLLTVLVIFKDGTSDIKECWDISDICLDSVLELRILRAENQLNNKGNL